jgi:serine/threonine protein kinase
LGSGTFADVFKVTQRNSTDTTHYAVKKSRRQFQSKRDREWLLNEVRTMKLLGDSHHHRPCPYIIQFVRAWQEDSFFYVQIGLAEKGTLRDLMNDLMHANQTLPDETLFRITHDVSAGLRHIHECGMIHLDIKPANLLITQGGLIQIGDFGMATYKGSRDDGHEGDTRYMAHELLNETERMPSADIFSLGLTLYELSYSKQRLETGCISLPFDGPMWHALRQGRADVVTDRPAVLVEVIERAMAPLPRDRPSAAQILQVAEVIAARDRADETLLLAKPIATQNQSALNRSSSFNPAFMSSLSIHTALTALPPDEYAALMERAFTPH